MKHAARLPALIVVLGLVAVRPAAAAWPHDPTVNVLLCNSTDFQWTPILMPEDSGGFIAAWTQQDASDPHIDSYQIALQRVDAGGSVLWGAAGVPIGNGVVSQYSPNLVSDGAGGAFIVFTAGSVIVQRVSAAGVPLWDYSGVIITNYGGSVGQIGSVGRRAAISDGMGGAIIAWSDTRLGSSSNVYAQRIDSTGASLWTPDGIPICTAPDNQVAVIVTPDGTGGAIIAWQDHRSGTDYDIYAQRVTADGTTLWTADGVVVSNAINDQTDCRMLGDGAGGAMLVWLDSRASINHTDVYAQRLTPYGFPLWGTNALAVCTAAGDQTNPRLISDDAGGVIVAWQDSRGGNDDIYCQRVTSSGEIPWTPDGVWLAANTTNESNPDLAPDGSGGATVVWQDGRNGNDDIYSGHIDAGGTPSWPLTTGAVCTDTTAQTSPAIIADGSGGTFVVWSDSRFGGVNAFAQRVAPFGYLGNPEPVVTAVADVPGDQGGEVSLAWTASYLESTIPTLIDAYDVWRSVPVSGSAPVGPQAASSHFTYDPEVAARSGKLLLTTESGGDQAWEYGGSVTADGSAAYAFTSSTVEDSIPGSNPTTGFMIEARSTGFQGVPYYFSVPVSGYSVDNLAPYPPSGFNGDYQPASVALVWHANTEPDLAEYRLYRGLTSGFTPGPGNLLGAVADTTYTDFPDQAYVYKLTAVDIHGNESIAVSVSNGQTGVENPVPARFALAPPSPNPAHGAATLHWSVPAAGPVELALYDVTGRRIRVWRAGPSVVGDFAMTIRLEDASGRSLADGIYFIRLAADGRSVTRRLAVVH